MIFLGAEIGPDVEHVKVLDLHMKLSELIAELLAVFAEALNQSHQTIPITQKTRHQVK
jgi:hypothetical protein